MVKSSGVISYKSFFSFLNMWWGERSQKSKEGAGKDQTREMSRAHGVERENKRIDRKKVFWRTRLERRLVEMRKEKTREQTGRWRNRVDGIRQRWAGGHSHRELIILTAYLSPSLCHLYTHINHMLSLSHLTNPCCRVLTHNKLETFSSVNLLRSLYSQTDDE